jgi:hypothetical protein
MADASLESFIGKTVVFRIDGATLEGKVEDILVDLSADIPEFFAHVEVPEDPGKHDEFQIPIRESQIVEVK